MMRTFTALFCAIVLAACSSVPETVVPKIVPPQLLIQQSLPPVPESSKNQALVLDMYLCIAEDGSVYDVQLRRGSGNSEWDSLAVAVIRQWRYSPARINNEPSLLWFHQIAHVQYADPLYISLAAIMCTSREEADSVYMALANGKDFNELAQQLSVRSSSAKSEIVSEVNLYNYPQHIQQVLLNLDPKVYSKPVKYGEHYAIFKRL